MLSRIPAQIMAVKPVFSEVVKLERYHATSSIRSHCRPAAAGRCRFDPDPAAGQAYQRTGKGLFQPLWPGSG